MRIAVTDVAIVAIRVGAGEDLAFDSNWRHITEAMGRMRLIDVHPWRMDLTIDHDTPGQQKRR